MPAQPHHPPSDGPEGPSESDKPQPATNENSSDSAVNTNPDGEYLSAYMHCEATELMTAARAGDVAAFETLAGKVRQRAFHLAHSLVGSREDALDLCQEAFMKAFRSRESYDPSQPFLPWFHRILRNTCFSFLRKNRRIKKRSLVQTGADGEEVEFEIIDPEPGPEAGLLEAERASLFRQAMQTLSPRDREILALRHFEDLPYKEIAATLGIPEGTVMSRLFHARRRLRETLAPLLEDKSSNPPRKGSQGAGSAPSRSRKQKETAL